MYELTEDIFYQLIAEYVDCCIDYCLLKDDEAYQGVASHRKALQLAIKKASSKVSWDWQADFDKALAKSIDTKELFQFPEKPWKHTEGSVTYYDDDYQGGEIPYWYAFLEPPQGTDFIKKDGQIIEREYTKEDFDAVNKILFPKGIEGLIVYAWSTDWSDYFDPGHEWWGVGCWTIYDIALDRYTVILASSTD